MVWNNEGQVKAVHVRRLKGCNFFKFFFTPFIVQKIHGMHDSYYKEWHSTHTQIHIYTNIHSLTHTYIKNNSHIHTHAHTFIIPHAVLKQNLYNHYFTNSYISSRTYMDQIYLHIKNYAVLFLNSI